MQGNHTHFTFIAVFEWIPYDRFNDIKIISKNLYSAVWKDGPLYCRYDESHKDIFKREPTRNVALLRLDSSQNITDESLRNKFNRYSRYRKYGISQNPETKDYVMVIQNGLFCECNDGYTGITDNLCKSCQTDYLTQNFINWTSGNEKIDNFIHMQLKIGNPSNIIFEWIPYNQFCDIKEIGKYGFSILNSAMWNDGPLYFNYYEREYTRESYRSVALKCLHDSQKTIDEILNEVKLIIDDKISPIYGISQSPDTKDYILVFNYDWYYKNHCVSCGKIYTNVQYKWCRTCQLKEYFITSESEKIDNFVQEMQLKVNKPSDVVFEWIPYNQFDEIKEIAQYGFFTVYSAKWKDGPLNYGYGYIRSSDDDPLNYRESDKNVTLKCLYKNENITDEFLNEVKKYSINRPSDIRNIYGISQNPDTKHYILVLQFDYFEEYCVKCNKRYSDTRFSWCRTCQTSNLKISCWISENEKIDKFIQEMQSKINKYNDIIFEWIPYNQFDEIKEVDKNNFFTVYSAKWKDGPLFYSFSKMEYIRYTNKTIALKCLYGSQNITDVLHEVKKYSINRSNDILNIYGITQNPDTKDYILVLHFEDFEKYCTKCNKIYTDTRFNWCRSCQISFLEQNFVNWTSENKKIDKFIQEVQSKINDYGDIILEWIPYNQFNNIKEIDKNDFNKTNSAIWMDGPLFYNYQNKKWARVLEKEVTLICFYNNSSDIINELLNEAEKYSIKKFRDTVGIYGISQNPDTKDYILVLQNGYCTKCGEKYTDIRNNWCKSCQLNNLFTTNWTSVNEKVGEFIQKMQSKINKPTDIIFEWIPYNKFNDIKEISKDGFTTEYLAIWMDGPLNYNCDRKEYERNSADKKVALKYAGISQNITDNFLNKAIKEYTINNDEDSLKIYGISQHPNTNNYILVLHERYFKKNFEEYYCIKCANIYTDTQYKWCKSCQIDYFQQNFTNWTSKNVRVDNFIREMQLKITKPTDIIFEWISYNQFSNIKEIGKGGFAIVYSAIWKDGPLYYDWNKYSRESNQRVALKCLNNSQNITDEFLNEVQNYSTEKYSNNILKIYGITQNPDTKDYIMVLEYADGGNFCDYWINNGNHKNFNWHDKIRTLNNIIKGLKEIHQKQMVHCDFHTGNILFTILRKKTYISDMGLCREVSNMNKAKIYGVMPYVAPEVLRGKSYTQAADVYSFGMIMYVTATGRQPFANRAHDEVLALDICNKIRPKIQEPEAPKCYIDLMKRCWDSNPDKRPDVTEVHDQISSWNQYINNDLFKQAEEYRKANLPFFIVDQTTTHPQAIYTSRILNSFTDDLKYDDNDDDDNSKCLDYAIND
ncbi:hypothetical protein RclHR1_01380020 [Rhizophagus clarus]|uniref:Protein kinase domain-containing protein n=1 Tax=Rhizophagus clarus TaxID=94130 RepID=A0A2Z6R3K4_9GLOM|nr:hypothetical protein RclHR1_01380020 [Rhizophagus clarus]